MNKKNFLKLSFASGLYAFFAPAEASAQEKSMGDLHEGPFGSCCKDLSDAMEKPPNTFFFEEENGVLFLTVGYVQTDQGPGWFDQAVIFCPFCGKKLRARENIARKSQSD